MSIPSIAIASAKSFGDFIIAHSVLRRIDDRAKRRVRLIACSHLQGLNAILPDEARVTLVQSGENRVPAIFDVKKCGAFAAVRSALSLRRAFQSLERGDNEILAFDALGVRERFIAGGWPVVAPRARSSNIYETYSRFLADQEIRTAAASPLQSGAVRSVGVFPESRLAIKRLGASTLTVILERVARAGLEPKLFVLEGDRVPAGEYRSLTRIPRNFASLANAIKSVGIVVSADSLPAHLAEYFARPVFVASPAANEYWLPHACFVHKRWGIFSDQARFCLLLDRFLAEFAGRLVSARSGR